MIDNFNDIKPIGLEFQPTKKIESEKYLMNPITLSWFTKLAAKIFENLFNIISPEIKNELQKFLNDLYLKAKQTSNPFDDFGVKLLATILNITLND